MLKKLGFYIFAALFIFAGQFLVNQDLVSGTPPAIAQTKLTGENAMQRISKGPAVLYFWAEWCGICRSMQGSVSNILRDYPGLTVAIRSGDDSKLQNYLNDKQLQWPVVNDNNGSIGLRYGIKGVPAVFFINAAGDIVFTTVGFTSEWGMRFRLWLAGLG
ncbi:MULTISPECIES: protein disulfide oxidoreductase [Methylomonas]|uniref:Alkyl hydroperoxide reductase n=2 Tax=Methylomonas TaxID=416 RepID=A0A140E4F8_9GAMM|nr:MULTISPECIES: protein disulfide oxidoreductase [Methylomonas]AMK75282.1 alkyl hydroperoxide reductase [Methylomonas denitrificans]OAH99326.1 alkyl hydroperoxide reductase [Methylomonas methanica]TCV84971.1 thiol-disulfide isomerase/thioredoxin [Methylomonas methanica]